MTRQARVQLEMGGKNPLVVLDDCDLERAVQCALDGAYFATGQRCTASSRIIVTQGIHDRFVEALTKRVQALRWVMHSRPRHADGSARKPSAARHDALLSRYRRKEGGVRRTGGERLSLAKPGYYVSPALIVDTKPDMRINCEEVFGPVASVVRVRDYDEALGVANAGEFGLSAGIVTSSLKYARHFARNVRAGMVMTNLPDRWRGLPRAVRRQSQVQLRRTRAGFRGDRVLYADQDHLFLGLIHDECHLSFSCRTKWSW